LTTDTCALTLNSQGRVPTSRSPTPSLTSSHGSRSTRSSTHRRRHHHHHQRDSRYEPESDEDEAAGRAYTYARFLDNYTRREELEDRLEAAHEAHKAKLREKAARANIGWGVWLGLTKEVVLTPEQERAKAFREWVDRE
jgi:hypothetical protein